MFETDRNHLKVAVFFLLCILTSTVPPNLLYIQDKVSMLFWFSRWYK